MVVLHVLFELFLSIEYLGTLATSNTCLIFPFIPLAVPHRGIGGFAMLVLLVLLEGVF